MKRALVRYFLLMLFGTPDLLTLSVYKEEIPNSIRFVNFVTKLSGIVLDVPFIPKYLLLLCIKRTRMT